MLEFVSHAGDAANDRVGDLKINKITDRTIKSRTDGRGRIWQGNYANAVSRTDGRCIKTGSGCERTRSEKIRRSAIADRANDGSQDNLPPRIRLCDDVQRDRLRREHGDGTKLQRKNSRTRSRDDSIHLAAGADFYLVTFT